MIRYHLRSLDHAINSGYIPDNDHQVAQEASNSIGSNISSVLGSGAYGTAYHLNNNMVCKVTTDKGEVINALKLVGHRNTYLSDIYGVYRSYDTYLGEPKYIILQEYLPSWRRKNISFVGIASETVNDVLSVINAFSNKHNICSWYAYLYSEKGCNPSRQADEFKRVCRKNGMGYLVDNIDGILHEARFKGIRLEDMHENNMAFKGDNITIIDYGGFKTHNDDHLFYGIIPIKYYTYPSNFPSSRVVKTASVNN
jgi:hypothetical protein